MRRADLRDHHYIYKIIRTDGKFYIGMHSTDDLADGYFGSGKKITRSIKRHGIEKHTKKILEFLPSRKHLKERERELVNEELLTDPKCMNLALGGNFLWPTSQTPKAQKKRTDALKEHYASDAGKITRAKISAANKGLKRTDEAKKNYSAAATKRMAGMKADGSWEEVKHKNAVAHQGKKQTPETVAKRMAGNKATKEANGGKNTFSVAARLNISKSLIGSARNVKTWNLVSVHGEALQITNLAKWLRENGLEARTKTVVRDKQRTITHRFERKT